MRFIKNIKFLFRYDLNECFKNQTEEISSLINRVMELKQQALELTKAVEKTTEIIENDRN